MSVNTVRRSAYLVQQLRMRSQMDIKALTARRTNETMGK